MSLQPKQFVFGPFKIEPANLLLLRNEKHILLPPKAFDTLVYLIQNTNRLVTRTELMSAIWPDSFVEDANLTVNISLLRKALGEIAPGQPYIETVPRKGYRFNAEVQAVESAAAGVPSISPAVEAVRPLPPAEDIPAGGSGTAFDPGRSALARQPARPEVIAFREPKRAPAAEPQPATLVGEDIEGVRQPARKSSLHRYGILTAAVAGLIVLGILAGKFLLRRSPSPEQIREVRLTSFAPEMAVTAAAISTGGKFIAYANPAGLFIQVIATGETHPLALPEPRFEVSGLSWFPDSAELLVGGSSPSDTAPGLWVVPIIGAGAAVKVGEYPRGVVSPDGTEIAMVHQAGATPEIVLMHSGVWQPREIAAARLGTIFGSVFWSHNGKRLFFVRQTWSADSRHNQGDIESYDLATGKTVHVLSAPDLGDAAVALPGGRIMYSTLQGDNLPTYYGVELFETATDHHTGRASGHPLHIATFTQPVTNLSANGSGRLLVFRMNVTQRSVYVADLGPGGEGLFNLRRITFGTGRDDYPHAWTHDSKAVLFDSGREGRWELFRQGLDGTVEQHLAGGPDDEYAPQVSPDGDWLLYIDRPKAMSDPLAGNIMRVPITGGVPQLVLKANGIAGSGFRFHCPSSAGAPCVLAQHTGDDIVFHQFNPAQGPGQPLRAVAQFPINANAPTEWCLSPDGARLAWIRFDPQSAVIHTLSFARKPAAGGNSKKETQVVLKGWSGLHSIHWAPNAKGWFLTTQAGAQWALLYASRGGDTRVLLRSLSQFTPWVVPSPDGRHLAFFQESSSSNVWMLENAAR